MTQINCHASQRPLTADRRVIRPLADATRIEQEQGFHQHSWRCYFSRFWLSLWIET
ncbi:MAG: hypothetical protein ABW096_14765 [Candidatus Thiodiazotropha sp.]